MGRFADDAALPRHRRPPHPPGAAAVTDGGWHDSEHQPVLAAGADGANWMATTGADGAWTLRLNGEAVGDPAGPEADGSVAAAEEWLGSSIDDPEIVTYMAARITRQPADPPA